MGEYIKYGRDEVKIGTLESLYYVSFEKYKNALESGKLSRADFGDDPKIYIDPDAGFRFRFPFPDEDSLSFGNIIEPFDRGIPVQVCRSLVLKGGLPEGDGSPYAIEIVGQRLIHRESDGKRCLALVCRDPSLQENFRIEADAVIKKLLELINVNHIANELDPGKKEFFTLISERIANGYKLDISQEKVQKTTNTTKINIIPKKTPGKAIKKRTRRL